MPNPLFTTIRFLGPTRGDGQIGADTLQTHNLRVGRNVGLANIERLEAAFDVFNALNGDTFQQFKSGGNQSYANFGRAADGTMQGQSRQFARAGQLSMRVMF